jgi:hypothetical protein
MHCTETTTVAQATSSSSFEKLKTTFKVSKSMKLNLDVEN